MSEAPPSVWLRQANSDRKSIGRILDTSEHWTYCQAIAKCQQTVEKSIKALVAALRERGYLHIHTGRTHAVEQLVAAMVRLPVRRHATRDIRNHLLHLLDEHRRGEIRAVCHLAPRWPSAGQPFSRNTEYPFQAAAEKWAAPADDGVFGVNDIRRFRDLAERIYTEAHRLICAIERHPWRDPS